MKLKIILLFILTFNSHLLGAMTKEWIVTRINYSEEKKIYHVDFKNQAGVYLAKEDLVSCLSDSLKIKQPFKIDFNPVGLKLLSCEKPPSKQ